jgi:hypothetical protein
MGSVTIALGRFPLARSRARRVSILLQFTPVPRDPAVLFENHPTASGPDPKQDPFDVKDFPLPSGTLVEAAREFARVCLILYFGRAAQDALNRKNWMNKLGTIVTEYISMV